MLGGGPAGLYLGIALKLRDPRFDVRVFERNRRSDTFGWGVVLSDETLHRLEENDPESTSRIRRHLSHWDRIAVVYRGTRTVSGGHGFSGIGRKRLLEILYDRAEQLGVALEHQREIASTNALEGYDVVVGADGLRSTVRVEKSDIFRPNQALGACRFVWLGTHQRFDDAFTFLFEETEHGWVWAHAYPFDETTATFIVECTEPTWRRLGFSDMDRTASIATCERIFAKHLDGHRLMSNAAHRRGSGWLSFPKILCERWWTENTVLLGDAAATAHFSVGSGTKLAMESAIALADALTEEPSLERAFSRYEAERRVEVLRLQSAARNSLEWFEGVERYLHLEPIQLTYALLTRSQRISHENLRARDPGWLAEAEAWFQERAGAPRRARPPMFAPWRVRGLELMNRVVVSPMAQYKAEDGCPGDWHLVHYGERAKGGAGLVLTEMTCVSAEGRISPGCAGLYSDAHEAAWRRIVGFVHAETQAKLGVQLGHSGPKGSTQLGWEEMDAPLSSGGWPVLGPSPIPWSEKNPVPRAMTREDRERVLDEHVAAARRAARAGFDWLELHAGHGYLLSSFLTPLTNRRSDAYGGSLENRLRYPLEVFRAMRSVWPAERPMSVRISATDWVGAEGITPDDGVRIATAFRDAGADVIDVSAGQTSTRARPIYGRLFQTPFCDRIRNEAHIPTMAVGNISTPDQVNSILLAGRADLVCLARAHLVDPYWTLRAAAELGDEGPPWPKPYLSGRDQLRRLVERGEGYLTGRRS